MPVSAKEVSDLCVDYIASAACLRDFPRNYQRMPFVELTYACGNDQALEYQPLVAKDLARKGYEYDINSAVPEPTLMKDLVSPENSEGYWCDEGWPSASLSIAKVSQ
eukprot:743335-Amphidinium_carterae.1